MVLRKLVGENGGRACRNSTDLSLLLMVVIHNKIRVLGLLKMLGKKKRYSSKWWQFNGNLPWYNPQKILKTNPRWIWSLSHYTSNSFSIKPPGLPPWLGDFFSGQIMPGQKPTSGITTVLLRKDQLASMDGVFTYIYHQKLRLNVGKYTILDEQLVKTSWKFSRETKCDMICKAFFYMLHIWCWIFVPIN